MSGTAAITEAGRAPDRRPPWTGRRAGWLLAATLAGVVMISIGVHHLLERGVTRAILAEAKADSLRWTRSFNAEYPGLLSRTVRGVAGAEDIATIENAIRLGSVFRLQLFGPSGRLVFDSDAAGADAGTAPINRTARRVFLTRAPTVLPHSGDATTRAPEVYAEAYVPAVNATGFAVGVIELHLDKTLASTVLRRTTFRLKLALPALTAIFFLVPALAVIAESEQARCRAKRVTRLALHDPLTGALNRVAFNQAAAALFSARAPADVAAVIFVEVDRFKSLSEGQGHDFSDRLLAQLGARIASALRPGDIFGRVGGDAFAVVLPGISGREARAIAARLLQDLRAPASAGGKTASGGIGMGLCLCPYATDLQQALHRAELALHHAKQSGRDRLVEYFDELDHAMERRKFVERALRGAWDDARMTVRFQPLIRPADGSVMGFEALLRLTAQTGEPISPQEFIPVAEDAGLICDIGLRVLRTALLTARTWPDHIFVSVNLSPKQFLQDSLVEDVTALLEELKFPGHRLELELTETLLLETEQSVARQIGGLRALGIKIAMDDFGTGNSSLGYLWKYGFDRLKIDGAVLEGFSFGRENLRDLIASIVAMGKQMGMQVTVEGVESRDQLRMLNEMDCDQYQGFLFGRPLPAAETLAAIRSAAPGGPASGGTVRASG